MLNECNGCEYQCKLSHIDICTLGSPCPHQRSTLMTNEEWRKTCSAEEFAEWIATQCGNAVMESTYDVPKLRKKRYWVEWLKEKHDA